MSKRTKPVVEGPVDGNAFAVIGAVKKALRKSGWAEEEITKVREEMMSGDYDHLLYVAQKYCDFEL